MIFRRLLSSAAVFGSLLALAAAPMVFVTGCSSDEAAAPPAEATPETSDSEDELKALTIKDADNGKSFQVLQGSNITVKLTSNPTTGYDWHVLSTSKSLGYPTKTFSGGGANAPVGSGGTTKLVWKTNSSLNVGTHTVELVYQRGEPGSADAKPSKIFGFTVTVVGKDPAPPKGACVKGGCSGQLCVEDGGPGGISTCEYREVYACYATAECARQKDGACGWTETEALTACVANGGPAPVKSCKRGGCSGQLCVDATSEDVASTCEWKEVYACYQAAACEVQGDGNCGFTPSDELSKCVESDGADPVDTGKGEGEFCGGIAGFQCKAGLECKLDGNYPDAGGTCVKSSAGAFCGGIGNIKCPEGFECQITEKYPDAGGSCVAKK